MPAWVPIPTPAVRLLAEIEARRLARREGESHADAWDRAIRLEDSHVRHILAEQTALDWAAEDPVAAWAAAGGLPIDDMVATAGPFGGSVTTEPLQMRIRSVIIDRWADRDPHAALAWILEQEGVAKSWYIQWPMIELTRRASDEAISRLAAFSGNLRRSAAGAVLGTLAHRDLDRALELFVTLDVDAKASHTHTLRRLLVERRSAEDALDWAMSVDHRIRAREVAAVISDVHEADRVEGFRMLGSIDDPTLRTGAASELVWDEVRHDAEEALAWARNFKPEFGRSELVVKVFDTWSYQDPEAACRALFELRGGPVRDRAAASMMSDVIGHDIRLAERLFDAIKAPEQQAKAAEPLHGHFADIEPNQRKAGQYRKYLPVDHGDT